MIKIFNEELELVGVAEEFKSFSASLYYKEIGTFNIVFPLTDKILEIVKPHYFIDFLGVQGRIDTITIYEGTDGKTLTASGEDLSGFLEKRVCYETYTNKGSVENWCYTLVNNTCASGAESARQFPFLEVSSSIGLSAETDSSTSRKTVLEEIQTVLNAYDYGFYTEADFNNKKIIFHIYNGQERDDIIVSKEFDVIKTQDYVYSNQQEINVVYAVADEDTEIINGDTYSGWNRQESIVDSSLKIGDEGIETLADLQSKLYYEGRAKLNTASQLFDVDIVEGIELNVGDIIKCRTKNWSINFSSRITEKDISVDSGIITYSYIIGNEIKGV